MNNQHVYLNGSIIPLSEAMVGISDIGITRGYGVYDGSAVIGGKLFRFEDHWARFKSSAAALELSIPAPKEAVAATILDLAQRNGLMARANVRMILTGGETVRGIEFDPAKPTFFIIVEPHEPLAPSLYQSGAKLITHEYQRFMPEHKTTHYITAVLLQNKRRAAGAVEILYHANGNVLECATSNIFIVKDGTLITPGEQILKGITRKTVLELAAGNNIRTEERSVALSELMEANEIFITSSFKDVLPIVDIDGTPCGGTVPGPITQALMHQFSERLNS